MIIVSRASILAMLIGVALTAFAFGGLVFSPPSDVLKPCAQEDSSHCYWDASERGNRNGQDVVNP